MFPCLRKSGMESRDQLQKLWEYQGLDREIAELEKCVLAIPKTMEAIEEEIKNARSEQVRLENLKKDLESERKRHESEIEAERERMRKTVGKQVEVKTNKEYSALLQEIDGIKEKIDLMETQILEVMEEGEVMGVKINEGAAQLQEREGEADSRKKAKQVELTGLEERLTGLQNDRKYLARDIDDDWVVNYNRIKASRGWAVSPLSENSCGGCHQLLWPQLVHEIKHSNEIKTCPHCMRILYVGAEAAKPAEPS